jgi:acetoin utilization protein AcuB
MNQVAPVSSLMTRHLVTISPDDRLTLVKEVFEKNSFHHLPVVRLNKIVGIISKTDFQNYISSLSHHFEDRFINEVLLKHHKADEIMTKKLAKIESTDRLGVAIEVFSRNMFHALPVVDNDELVGILTVHDILRALASEKIRDEDYHLTIV